MNFPSALDDSGSVGWTMPRAAVLIVYNSQEIKFLVEIDNRTRAPFA
ncbi:MAG: hypothetical protein ACK4F8_11625 [Aquabacterium sp.]